MAENSERSIVPLSERRLAIALSGDSRIAAAMVHEALVVARDAGHSTIGESPQQQYERGLSHYQGIGVPQDYAEAVKCFRKAAERAHSCGQYILGSCYRHGRGVPQDYDKAIEWVRLAAEQGLAEAEHALSICYSNGEGVPKDETEAVRWSRRAAEHGLASGQTRLGFAYHQGHGVVQDYSEAITEHSKKGS